MNQNASIRSVIWDLPTRLFHWFIVLSFVMAWLTYDDNRFLFFHVFSGYVFIGLLLFRLLWGFIGTHYARFHSFAYDWGSVSAYLKALLNGSAMRHIGHNPAGGWAIFFMLVLGMIIGFTGIFTLSGEEGHGMFRGWVSFDVGVASHGLHETLAWIMLGMVALHLLGVLVESLVHRENLIWSMITGHKESDAGVASVHGHHLLGLTIVLIVSVSALVYFRGYLNETADNLYQPYKGPELPDNAQWREQCGECHFAYHPTLLPRRSWEKIFAEQHEHFGDDLDLDEDTYNELLKFHVDNAAETLLTEPAHRILSLTPDNETPIRVTETHYWVKKHKDIPEYYWKHKKVRTKGNCSACHLDSDKGTYEDSDMRLPK